ncbi:MAG: hypothetical protein KJ077_10535 [Anaerolineae bacterium]|nr:hypothetical protein [Anaerolineae bacterium]
MANVAALKAALLDEWLALESLRAVITTGAGTYHDSATGKFTSRPGSAARRLPDFQGKAQPMQVSERPWSEVDKVQLGNQAARMYANGELTRQQVEDIYTYVPPQAFGKGTDGKPKFFASMGWGPHHEMVDGQVVLSRRGLAAAWGAINGARSKPKLSPEAVAQGQKHLRQHYRELEETNAKKS